jgi:putative ATP-binding cassette transporter
MKLVDLVTTEAGDSFRSLFVTASLAGAANVLVIGLVQSVAASPGNAGFSTFVTFGLAVLLYVICARRTYHRSTSLVEAVLTRIKRRIVEKIGKLDLRSLERIGSAEIHDRLTENTTVISTSSGMLANLLQSLCIVVFAVLYIAYISLPAFGLVMLVTLMGMWAYVSKKSEIDTFLRQAGQTRLAFLDLLGDLLKGFKEIKFSARRRSDLTDDVNRGSDALSAVTMKANHLFDDNLILATCILFGMLGSIVFVLPQHVTTDTATLAKLVAGATFIWGPLGGVAAGFPAYMRSNAALNNIKVLEEKLDAAAERNVLSDAEDPWQGPVREIAVRGVEYEYPISKGAGRFHVGPVDLSFAAGEIVFIVGGNGSGKSTLLKVITGLYPAMSGSVVVDGIRVEPSNVEAYREKISAIYSDFHLFTKLYGLLGVEEGVVQSLLVQMQLDDKTSFKDRRFTNRDLSTGQRKRLAMIVSLLEDRSFYVFDEWAADQDPEFRKYFYDELLPDLKRRGKAVLAVSHDDRYFRCADRVITMEYGQIRSIEQHGENSSPQPPSGG